MSVSASRKSLFLWQTPKSTLCQPFIKRALRSTTSLRQYASTSAVTAPAFENHQQSTTLYFTIGDKVGALDDALREIRSLNISLTSIESRPSRNKGEYEFFCDFVARDSKEVDAVVSKLTEAVKKVMVVSSGSNDAETCKMLLVERLYGCLKLVYLNSNFWCAVVSKADIRSGQVC